MKILSNYNTDNNYNTTTTTTNTNTTNTGTQREIFDFFVTLSKTMKPLCIELINSVPLKNTCFDKRILVQLLKNCGDYAQVQSPNYYVQAYRLEALKDHKAANYIPQLVEDAEDLKLVLKMVDTFSFSPEEYTAILEIFAQVHGEDLQTEEIQAKCLIKLGSPITFGVDASTARLFYYFVREGYIPVSAPSEKYRHSFSAEFYAHFRGTTDYAHCFEILGLLARKGERNKDAFEFMHQIVPAISLGELSDLIAVLGQLEFRQLFYTQIYGRLVEEAERTDDFELLERCCNKFINILVAEGRNDVIVEMLAIDYFNVSKKIVAYLKAKTIESTDRLVYHLLVKYNSCFYYDLQPMIVLIMVRALKTPHGYHSFASFKTQGLQELRNVCMTGPEKKSKAMMKEYLIDIKAKKISELNPINKVSEQNFMQKDADAEIEKNIWNG